MQPRSGLYGCQGSAFHLHDEKHRRRISFNRLARLGLVREGEHLHERRGIIELFSFKIIQEHILKSCRREDI